MVGVAKKSERGVALLVTMMALALMTMLVMDFTTSASLGYRSAAGQANELRAEYLARSAVSVGLSLLSTDARQNATAKTPYDGLDQRWAMPFPPVPLGGGEAQVSIIDEARKIDINLLINPRTGQANPPYVKMVERLFANLGVSPALVPAIVDWLDPDSIESAGGAESDYYLRLIPPYEPRNGPMPTIGDLRMIRGVDDVTFLRLQQFLTASPEPRVNINTAPPEVIAALLPQLSDDTSMVKQIVQARSVQPFLNITDVGNLAGLGDAATPLLKLITTRSNYFSITGVGVFAGARRRVTGTFRRNANGSSMLASWQEG
jgi:general secretion pathway protein K